MIVKMTAGVKLVSKRMVTYLGKDKSPAKSVDEDKLKESVLYLEKENSGQKHEVKLGGYMNVEIRKEGIPPDSNKLNDLIVKKWNEILESKHKVIPKNGVGVRRFIISPDPKKMANLSKEQQEKLLHGVVRASLKKFKDQFFKNDQIGYIHTVHKDKDHMHAHVYLNTVTKDGAYVSMNASKYKNINGKLIEINNKVTKDKLKTFKKMISNSFDKQLKQLDKTISNNKGPNTGDEKQYNWSEESSKSSSGSFVSEEIGKQVNSDQKVYRSKIKFKGGKGGLNKLDITQKMKLKNLLKGPRQLSKQRYGLDSYAGRERGISLDGRG